MNTLRINFDESELQSIDILMKEFSIGSRQKLIRALINQAMIRGSKARAYGEKPAGTGAVRTNTHQRRKALEALSDEELSQKLKPLLDREFRKTEHDIIVITTEPTTKGRAIYAKLFNPGGHGHEEATMQLSYYLNQWQKDKSLDQITLN